MSVDRRIVGIALSVPLWMGAAVGAAELVLEPCEIPGLTVAARCGTYEVFEDREAASGRTIPLRVVVLPATGDDPEPDPLVFFAGGPGGSSVEAAPALATFYAEEHRRRAILLVDYRGSGKSGPLVCPYQEGEGRGIEEALESFLPVDRLDECREALAARADLSRYTTPILVDDVDEVRRALGYERLNLLGSSYGTRMVLVYLRRHPEAVRTAMIEGAVPTDARMPATFAWDAQAALEGWFRECAEDAACHAAFPHPAGDLATALARLDEGPVAIEVTDPKTRRPVELRLSRNGFVQALRYLLYDSLGALKIPAFVHAAAAGDWGAMAQTAYSVAGGLLASTPDGLYLSVTCTEDVARVGPNAAAVQVGTFLGDLRVRQQVAACRRWPRGELPEGFHEPVSSDVPVLVLSGERDPVTPARWGREVQEFLTRSAHLVVPDGGHTWFGLPGAECLQALHSKLLETADVGALDLEGCRRTIGRPPFLLEARNEDEIPMSRQELERYAGTYSVEGGGFRIVLEVTDEGLMALVGEDTMRLVPLGSGRFRIAGEPPGDFYRLVEEDGEVRRFEVILGGVTQVVLAKGE